MGAGNSGAAYHKSSLLGIRGRWRKGYAMGKKVCLTLLSAENHYNMYCTFEPCVGYAKILFFNSEARILD